jgi:hypothetical protein
LSWFCKEVVNALIHIKGQALTKQSNELGVLDSTALQVGWSAHVAKNIPHSSSAP